MQIPAMFQDIPYARLFQGASFGAIATILIGFNWGGWTLESTAKNNSREMVKNAVTSVLTPICVDNFNNSADQASNLVRFQSESAYKQGRFIEDGGWAIFPGTTEANREVARACAVIISDLN